MARPRAAAVAKAASPVKKPVPAAKQVPASKGSLGEAMATLIVKTAQRVHPTVRLAKVLVDIYEQLAQHVVDAIGEQAVLVQSRGKRKRVTDGDVIVGAMTQVSPSLLRSVMLNMHAEQ